MKVFTIECWDGERLSPERDKTAAFKAAFEVIESEIEGTLGCGGLKSDDRPQVQEAIKEFRTQVAAGNYEKALSDWNEFTNDAWDGRGEVHVEEVELD